MGTLALAAAIGIWIENHIAPAVRLETRVPQPNALVETAVEAEQPPAAPVFPLKTVPKPPVTTAPSPEVDWTSVELRADYVLHDLGLCLENTVTVEAQAGLLRVEGVVSSAAMKVRLLERLHAALPEQEIQVSLQSTEDLVPDKLPAQQPPEPVRVTGSAPPLEARLRAELEREGLPGRAAARRASEILTAGVRLAEQAWSEAWAVEHLARRYPAARLTNMNPRQRRLVETMAMTHLSRLCEAIEGEQRLLAPYLETPRSSGAEETLSLLPVVQRIERLVAVLLAGSETVAEPVESLSAELAELLAAAIGAIEDIESAAQQEARWFPIR